jgi:predicted ABC-type ATPase
VFCQVRGRYADEAEETRLAAPDAKLDLVERERLRREQPGSELEQRLANLSDSHPSGPGYGDSGAPPGGGEDDGEAIEPLTDAEYAEHLAEVETKLDQARAAGLATDVQHTIDRDREVWSDERQAVHDEIVKALYARAASVPCEYKAILAGGPAGAGKTTVLSAHADVDSTQYFMINPDTVKEEMARRGLIPEVGGLSPMESSDLVHEESSFIARRLGHLAQADGKNLVWDITMSKETSIERRVDGLRSVGYSHIEAIFVDIPIEVSLRRAAERHRDGHDQYRLGNGLGGRYVPPRLILDQADQDWGSKNRGNFERTKGLFDGWSRYDNSIDGRPPLLVEAHNISDDGDRRDH